MSNSQKKHEVQMSPANNGGVPVSSYQQPQLLVDETGANNNGIGLGMAKILERQHQQHGEQEEEDRRSKRYIYVALGCVLLIVYCVLARKHFFEHHGIVVPSFGETTTTALTTRDEDESSLSQQLEMEGSSKKKKKKKNKGNDDDDGDIFTNDAACDDGYYSKRTLQRAFELPFASLFKDTKGQKKYEASDVILVDGEAYAVCDNSWAISKFGDDLRPFSPENAQIGDPNRQGLGGDDEDSGYVSRHVLTIFVFNLLLFRIHGIYV